MNMNVKFEGMIENILNEAVRQGLAKTKTEALRLGVLELNSRFHLIEKSIEEAEEEEDLLEIEKARELIKSGKIKLLSYRDVFGK